MQFCIYCKKKKSDHQVLMTQALSRFCLGTLLGVGESTVSVMLAIVYSESILRRYIVRQLIPIRRRLIQ